ncbi:hypothetical protein ABZW18_00720 [Streptomyces sp. NPDC004647]|uniref:hypothetical protein n=1 Tax=Streptomyces sp. NPDC004647 TaxID=3154671 RepID=UPI0033A1E975
MADRDERFAHGRAEEEGVRMEQWERSLPLRLELIELEQGLWAGPLTEEEYAEAAAPLWDELFTVVEGAAPEQGAERRWYNISVEGDATSLGTLTGDPVEAMVQWAQLDRPHHEHVVTTGVAEVPGLQDLTVTGLVRRALQRGGGERLAGALAAWIDRNRQEVAVPAQVVERDPAALRRAGWAWALRVGDPVPPSVLERLGPEEGAAVKEAAAEMERALLAAELEPGLDAQGWGPREGTLRGHWQVLAAAAVSIPEAGPPARKVVDQLVAADPDAPAPPQPGDPDTRLRQSSAQAWFWTREQGRTEMSEVFRMVADPAHAPGGSLPRLFAVLPGHLRAQPVAAYDFMRAAERVSQHQALQPLYEAYPDLVRQEKQAAVDEASHALLAQCLTQAREASYTETARPSGAGNPPEAVLRPSRAAARAEDPAQRAALQPPHHPRLR